jgi:hypothetical protein
MGKKLMIHIFKYRGKENSSPYGLVDGRSVQ